MWRESRAVEGPAHLRHCRRPHTQALVVGERRAGGRAEPIAFWQKRSVSAVTALKQTNYSLDLPLVLLSIALSALVIVAASATTQAAYYHHRHHHYWHHGYPIAGYWNYLGSGPGFAVPRVTAFT